MMRPDAPGSDAVAGHARPRGPDAVARVGRIRFVNCFPLYHHFAEQLSARGVSADIVDGYPSDLNDMLARGAIDVTLSSSIAFARNADDALDWIQRAQQAAVEAKQSPARYLLQELELRRLRNEPQACQLIFMRLQTQHAREPGVAEALYAWLRQIGAIAPDGRPAMRPDEAGSPAAAASAAAPAGPGIWTPDQPAAPAAGQPKTSIWVPGMD